MKEKLNVNILKKEQIMKIKFKKLYEDSHTPLHVHSSDAGFDLYVHEGCYDNITDTYIYKSGIAVEIPEGYVGLLFPRSSVYKCNLILSNSVGVIDAGYRGEVMARFRTSGSGKCIYGVGDRFCQLVAVKIPEIELEEVDELSASDRGTGGYGSSGK